jgi:diguanylate cyclase (GGDEF)-like protein
MGAQVLTPEELGALLTRECQPLHVLDPQDMRICYQNRASIDLFGPLADFGSLLALRDTVAPGGALPLHGLYRLRSRQGARLFFLEHMEREGWVVHRLSDVSALGPELEDLARDLPNDPQTRALSAGAFLYALAREMSRRERGRQSFQLLRLDLGGTPWPKGRHGRDAIDYALTMAAEIVLASVREADVLGRCEATVLTLILPETDAQGAERVAERLRGLLLRAPLQVAGGSLALSVEVGWAEPRPGDTPQQLLQRALEAQARTTEVEQAIATGSEVPGGSSDAGI